MEEECTGNINHTSITMQHLLQQDSPGRSLGRLRSWTLSQLCKSYLPLLDPPTDPNSPPPDTTFSSPAKLLIQARNRYGRRARGSNLSLRGSSLTPAAAKLQTFNPGSYAAVVRL